MSESAIRMAEAEAAQAAWDRFVGPAIAVCRDDYTRKLAEMAVQPMEGRVLAGVEKLALAIKVVDQVEGQLRALIADGKVAANDATRAADMARMPTEAKRWAGY